MPQSILPHSWPRLLCLAVASLCGNTSFAAEATLSKEGQDKLNLRVMRLPSRLQERPAEPDAVPSKRDAFEKAYDLFIRYTDGTIYNPSTKKNDAVNLRAYQQKTDTSWNANDPNGSKFQAPTVVMEPGQTVRFRLHNQLTEQTQEKCANTEINSPNQPTCFNVTNLHSHGLWVSPTGNSDNVLLAINPNVNFEYEYNVPVDHPAGTFWYHPHIHGTTAMQVASGMAGALVVEGDRFPSPTRTGDIDTLLKVFQPKASGSSGEVMMLQQIPYACFTDANYTTYHTTYDAKGKEIGPWTCGDSEIGRVENFNQVGPPNAWRTSGRYTLVNGQAQPKIDMLDKQVVRWRLIDAGFQETVKLRIRHITQPKNLENLLAARSDAGKIETTCDGVDVTQFEVATDGLTHSKTISKTTNFLQPGYRSDILFALPKPGFYCVYDDAADTGLNDSAKSARLLAVIQAKANPQMAGTDASDQTLFMKNQLIAAAEKTQPATVKAKVISDLNDGLQLSKFVPHKSFPAARLEKLQQKKKEYVTFNIANLGGKTRFMVEGNPALNEPANVKFAYQADRIDHTLVLGDEQIWQLNSKVGSHPFHIHVNPFQIISITDPKVITDPAQKKSRAEFAAQYKDMIGTWKDTLMVGDGFKIEVATRYQRYIGEYVLHCHILEHEDQGMMQNVKVVLPDGKGGIAGGGHQH